MTGRSIPFERGFYGKMTVTRKILPLVCAMLVAGSVDLLNARYNPDIHTKITEKQLVGFVREAYYFAVIYGKSLAAKEFSNKKGLFHRGELYIFAYDMKGQVVAHGANPSWVGKDFSQLKDTTGKSLIAEMIKIVKTKGEGTIRYTWFHPKTNVITNKLGYVKKVDNEWWLGSGIYLKE